MRERAAAGSRTPCDRACAGLCRADGIAAAHLAHHRWLLSRCRALLGDPGAAEDAVQETFLRAWRACGSFDPAAGPSLATWLGTIARNVAVDALSEVSPEHRGVVLLAVVRDRPYADVAVALDIPVGTVKSRVHHALRGMRRTLDRTELAA